MSANDVLTVLCATVGLASFMAGWMVTRSVFMASKTFQQVAEIDTEDELRKVQKSNEEREHDLLEPRKPWEWHHKYCDRCKHRQKSPEEIAMAAIACAQQGHAVCLDGSCAFCGAQVDEGVF
jgi:hypothetical protein